MVSLEGRTGGEAACSSGQRAPERRFTADRKTTALSVATSFSCPEWSEYLDRHRVRHLWECEACGYKFETLVSFAET